MTWWRMTTFSFDLSGANELYGSECTAPPFCDVCELYVGARLVASMLQIYQFLFRTASNYWHWQKSGLTTAALSPMCIVFKVKHGNSNFEIKSVALIVTTFTFNIQNQEVQHWKPRCSYKYDENFLRPVAPVTKKAFLRRTQDNWANF
jgi:hypothetical protein